MTSTTQLILSSLVALLLAAWRSGAIRLLSERVTPRLPKWAQPIPPFVLATLATFGTVLQSGGTLDADTIALASALLSSGWVLNTISTGG